MDDIVYKIGIVTLIFGCYTTIVKLNKLLELLDDLKSDIEDLDTRLEVAQASKINTENALNHINKRIGDLISLNRRTNEKPSQPRTQPHQHGPPQGPPWKLQASAKPFIPGTGA